MSVKLSNTDLIMITNRGIKGQPKGLEEIFCTDYCCNKFEPNDEKTLNKGPIIQLLLDIIILGVGVTKTKKLSELNGKINSFLVKGQ